jgi:hypothetical protein
MSRLEKTKGAIGRVTEGIGRFTSRRRERVTDTRSLEDINPSQLAEAATIFESTVRDYNPGHLPAEQADVIDQTATVAQFVRSKIPERSDPYVAEYLGADQYSQAREVLDLTKHHKEELSGMGVKDDFLAELGSRVDRGLERAQLTDHIRESIAAAEATVPQKKKKR